MLTFTAPSMSEHYTTYPQMLVKWNGQQVGIASENSHTRRMSWRWEFYLLSERAEPVAIADSLMALADKIEAFVTTWESHESTWDGLAAAKALPGLKDSY